MNWTEILKRAGVPDAPGYQELLAQIREEKLQQTVDTVSQPTRKRGKRKR